MNEITKYDYILWIFPFFFLGLFLGIFFSESNIKSNCLDHYSSVSYAEAKAICSSVISGNKK